MKLLTSIALIGLLAGSASAETVLFELSCQSYVTGGVKTAAQYLEYDEVTGINLMLHPDFLEALKSGFCVLGPVDVEARSAALKKAFADYLAAHPSPLDELQGVPR